MPKYKKETNNLIKEAKKLVFLLYGKGFTQEEVARILNRSRFWVLQVIHKKT